MGAVDAPLRHSESGVDKGRRRGWWRRIGSKERGFRYVDRNREPITDQQELLRIQQLVIPPAWRDVRICPRPGGRLQAVGLDKNGRIQYLYHAQFAEKRRQEKYARIERFGERLPLIRQATNEHLELDGFPAERVIALMIRLIDDLHFRLGANRSVTDYRTYGITTLRNRHLTIRRGGILEFNYIAKHHIRQRNIVVDRELAELLGELKQIGGARLFEFMGDDGQVRPVLPRDVNRYVKTHMGPEFSSKDFRTWAGTLQAALILAEIGPAETERAIRKNVVQAVKKVAERLGNTPTVCRSCYIHPVVFERYEAGVTLEQFRPKAERVIRRLMPDYEPEELSLLALFRAEAVPTDREASDLIDSACASVLDSASALASAA